MTLSQMMSLNSNTFLSFQNFLRHSAQTELNIHPDANGVCEATIDTAKYSTALIIALDEKSSTQQVIDLGQANDEIEKRSLALDKPLDVEKYYNEVRNCDKVQNGQTVTIEDITSTEHMIIDSLDKVFKVQTEIARILGKSKLDEDLEFLLKWNTFEEEEKNKKYSKFCCHEVNLFLYFKDPTYFTEVVRPFIVNKMEKSFIDHWLLGDYAQILEFGKVENLDQLNSLEKCLLIFALRQTDVESATNIAKLIKLKADNSDYSADQLN